MNTYLEQEAVATNAILEQEAIDAGTTYVPVTAQTTTGTACTPPVAETGYPTAFPTAAPTAAPTDYPTAAPTAAPTKAPTAYPTAYPTASPTKAPTAYPTASPTDAPTPLWNPDEHNQFCASGFYYAPVQVNRSHSTYDVEQGESQTCHKCERGYTSQGGISPTCHPINAVWNICSHLGCKLSSDAGCNLARHASANPAQDLADNKDIAHKFFGSTACASGLRSTSGTERLVVFHHGFENQGTTHKCALTGDSGDYDRSCVCVCKDVEDADEFHAESHLSTRDGTAREGVEHQTARSGDEDQH
jgi:hypothetical protein